MVILFFILMVLSSLIITLFILVQNPKGGGLSGSIAGFNSQFMGVKQTTDVLEKGTWVVACLIALLCLFSPAFINGGSGSGSSQEPNLKPSTQQQQTAPVAPGGLNTVPPPSPAQP